MRQKNNKVLIFSAHPDDAELGMGGTIGHFFNIGLEVMVINLTDGEPTPMGTPSIRKTESREAASLLGFTRKILKYKNRELTYDIDTRDHIAGIIRAYRPAAVFSHYREDSHPDHRETNKIVEDAVFAARLTKSRIPGEPHRVSKVCYYFAVHLKKLVKPDFFIVLSKEEHRIKMESLKCYRSQFVENRKNSGIFDYIKSRDRYWGFIADGEYAEGFKIRESINIKDIRDIL